MSTRADVRALYEKVIANPAIEKYRGYTDTKSYGWDAISGEYIKREGEVWFENPSFVGVEECAEEIFDAFEEEEEQLFEPCLPDETEEETAVALAEAEERVAILEEENARLAAERDEAVAALLELRDALMLVAKLAVAE